MTQTAYLRRAAVILWDTMSWMLALGVFVAVRHDFTLSERVWETVAAYTVLAVIIQVGLGVKTHLYLGRSPLGSFDDVATLSAIVLGTAAVLGVGFLAFAPVFSRGLALAMPLLALLLMVTGRAAFRWLLERQKVAGLVAARTGDPVPALIYGAGDAGHQVARLIDTADEPPYSIVGFIDDDPNKRHLRIRGHRVLGKGAHLVDIARRREAKVIVLAIATAPASLMESLQERCDDAGLDVVVVPPVRDMIGGRVELSQLRELDVTDLLGRRPIETDLAEVADYLCGQVVLVTGAGGSIGSELARQVHQFGPAKLILLDRDESALQGVQLKIYGSGLLDRDDLVLCNIREIDSLWKVFDAHRPDVVFHAAALKHLPLLERYPQEGWMTNVVGSLNVLRCAAEFGVQHVVNISTDKAANPTSTLGRTKFLAEQLTAWYAEDTGRPWVSVRFGNVLGSRGSMLDAFRGQIEQGGPLTVTHPEVSRYFMTIPEACELVLQAGALGDPGDVLVLDMGEPVRIIDVARRLIRQSRREIEIEFTGLRPGEKLHEILFSEQEDRRATEHALIHRVSAVPLDPHEIDSAPLGARRAEDVNALFAHMFGPLSTAVEAEGLR